MRTVASASTYDDGFGGGLLYLHVTFGLNSEYIPFAFSLNTHA
jgi:hypothetical protein